MKHKLLRALWALPLFLLCAVSLHADDRAVAKDVFREHEANHFFALPVDGNSIVFIGNSITDMHEWAEAFNNPDILNRGISGAVSDELVENLEAYISGKPKKVFLMIGTNDLAQVNVFDYTYPVRNTKKMVEHIRRVSPATEIYVQSILPVTNAEKAPKIVRSNELLREYCQEEGITYVDLWSLLVTPGTQTIRSEYTPEGLHLTAKGYAVWCRAIESYVGSPTIYPDPSEVVNDNGGISAAMPAGRTTVFGALPVKSDDILMVGGFMTSSGQWYELFKDLRIKNRGIGWGYPTGEDIGMTKSSIRPMLKGLADNEEPAKIFLQTGIANMNNNQSVSAAISSYTSLLDEIRKYAPNTHIYVEALLPSGNANYNTNRYAPFNKALKELAESRDNTTFIDTYTPFLSDAGVASSEYFSGNFIYGKGYAKWAEILAPYIGDDATPLSVDEASALLAKNKLRQTLGQLAINAEGVETGDDSGQYPAAAVQTLQTALDAANAVLAKGQEATDDEIKAQTTALTSALNTALAAVNMPHASTADATYWYNITTPLRNNLYITAAEAGQGLTGTTPAGVYDENVMWKFTDRGDGSFDIISAAGNVYLDPSASANAQIKVTAAEPSKGWTLKPAKQSGIYTICSSTVQLNQGETGNNFKLLNWGSGTNTTDIGCQFAIVPIGADGSVDEDLPAPLLTLTDIELDGNKPYRVPDADAAPVLAANSVTAVIDFTPASTPNGVSVLTGSTAETAAAPYVGVILREYGKAGVLYAAADPASEVWHVATGLELSGRHHLVVTMQPSSPAYTFNMDGTFLREAGTADSPTLGSPAGTSALYVGGLVTADNANLYPFQGTIHSVRYYAGALSRQQITQLTYASISASADSLYFIRNKATDAFVGYDPESVAGASDPDVVLSARSQYDTQNFFRIAGNETDGFTIRLAADPRYYVYAINTDNADSNVGIAAFDAPTAACYWQIGQQGEGWNIVPKGGNYGWTIRGSYNGKSHVGLQNSNADDSNIWYIETPSEYAVQWTGTGKVGDLHNLDKDVVRALEAAFDDDAFDKEVADNALAAYQDICSGNLVTPASGLYQIKNIRKGLHLYWDSSKKAVTFANDGSGTPKYYWSVTFDGNNAVITSSTGKLFAKSPGGYYSSITAPDAMSSVALQRAPNSTTGEAYTEDYFLFTNVHLSEDKSYTIQGYSAYNSDTNPYFLTTYASTGAGNQYSFEPVAFTGGETAYFVRISGAPEGEQPTLTYNGAGYDGDATSYDGGFFVLSSTPSAADFTATEISGMRAEVTVEDGAVRVDYTVPTGLGTVLSPDASPADAPLYDAAGRRVFTPSKGRVYIQNGRKYLGQ